jgi:hypothetical protein
LANSYAVNANAAKGAARRFWGRGSVNHATTRTRLIAVAIRMCWRCVFAKPMSRDRRKSNGSALHVMLFLENTLQALFIFNGLRSRHCQRALLGYHYRGAKSLMGPGLHG